MIALLAPGQGSQRPGCLRPWIDEPGVAEHIRWLSALADIDLEYFGCTADGDALRDTAIAQPLLVATTLVSARAILGTDKPITPKFAMVAGHSVGEIAAAVLVGSISTERGMVFARDRGRAMARACARRPTGMSAVVGGDLLRNLGVISSLGLEVATANGPNQIVAAGTIEQLSALAVDPPEGSRVVPLKVAGAFHTAHMATAASEVEPLLDQHSLQDPTMTLLSNYDGKPVATGAQVAHALLRQILAPVRWDLCMNEMVAAGVSGIVELAPAGTLTGFVLNAMPGVRHVSVRSPADGALVHELISG